MILVKKWFDYKLLTINFDKTHYLPLSCTNASLPPFVNIEINTGTMLCTILPVKEIKYLGIYIDSHLNWNSHINYIIKKLQYVLYKFQYLKKILSVPQLKVLYHALVESHINYGIIAWGGVSKTNLNPLNILQKRFLKIILSKEPTYPSTLLYSEAQVFSARQLYFYNLNLRYHCTKSVSTLPTYQYTTRQKDRHRIPFMTKSIGQRSFHFLAPRTYNSLPKEIRNIKISYIFKKKLKLFILSNPLETFYNYIDLKNS